MYNRYDGNTGRFVRIPEPEPPARRQQPALRNPPPPPERRPTYNPPPERSPYKPIEVWWMFSRGEFAAFLLNCFAVPGLLLLTFPLGWYIGGDAASFITGLGVLLFVLFISPIAERLIDGF